MKNIPQILLLVNLFGIRRVIKYSSCVIYWDNDLAEKSKGDKSFKRGKSFAPKNSATQPEFVLTHIFFICQKYGKPKKRNFVSTISISQNLLENKMQDISNVYMTLDTTTTPIGIKNWYLFNIASFQKHFMLRINSMQLVWFKTSLNGSNINYQFSNA